jgi:hypothetical protein
MRATSVARFALFPRFAAAKSGPLAPPFGVGQSFLTAIRSPVSPWRSRPFVVRPPVASPATGDGQRRSLFTWSARRTWICWPLLRFDLPAFKRPEVPPRLVSGVRQNPDSLSEVWRADGGR